MLQMTQKHSNIPKNTYQVKNSSVNNTNENIYELIRKMKVTDFSHKTIMERYHKKYEEKLTLDQIRHRIKSDDLRMKVVLNSIYWEYQELEKELK